MSGLEVALITAAVTGAATGVGRAVMSHLLRESSSEVKKSTRLAALHKQLTEKLGSLLASQRDKQVEALSGQQRYTTESYRNWTKRVSNIGREVDSLNKKYERRIRGLPHRKLTKKIKEALKEVTELIEECPPRILFNYEPPRVLKEDGVKSISKYPTLQNAYKGIKDGLRSDGVKCVALYGTIGVGKTTIMKRLNNHHYKDFDMVIFIEVAADEQTNMRTEFCHILRKIADRINTDREGDEYKVAGRIQSALKNKRCLLILDGIRHNPIGILKKWGFWRSWERHSKVIITTHYCLTSQTKRDVDRIVKLNPLNSKEACDMFINIVHDNLLQDEIQVDIETIRQVCTRFCCCLPLLIYRIACSFALGPRTGWEKALKKLTPWPEVGVEGIKELYQHFEISFHLLDSSRQKIFLYASLYPANSNIHTHYLVECGVVQGFLSNVEADTGSILSDLVDFSFLEQRENMRYVKMNYLYWQLASYVLSKDSRQHAKWFSRIGSKSDADLPAKKNYSRLEALLLQWNMKLVEFQENFFDRMGNLCVLDLSRTQIRMLPSLKKLKELKAFYLKGCSQLKLDRDQIKPLEQLQIFDIRDTAVNFLPCLKSLRCLRMSCIATIAYHKISDLQNLEELTIEVNSRRGWFKNAQCIIYEVAALKNLATLRCTFYLSENHEEFPEAASESWIREEIIKKAGSLPFQFLYKRRPKKSKRSSQANLSQE